MAVSGLAAISGPAGRSTERTSPTGTVLSSNQVAWRRTVAFAEGEGHWGAGARPLAARRVVSFDVWAVSFRNDGTVGRDAGPDLVRVEVRGGLYFVQPAQ